MGPSGKDHWNEIAIIEKSVCYSSFLLILSKNAIIGKKSDCSYPKKILALWGVASGDKEKIPWVSWKDVCRPKSEGGLGVKDLKWFNVSLLAKWRWRLLVEDKSLWKNVHWKQNIVVLGAYT
jgi:hypothetical protein